MQWSPDGATVVSEGDDQSKGPAAARPPPAPKITVDLSDTEAPRVAITVAR